MKKKFTDAVEDFVVDMPERRWRVFISVFTVAVNALGVAAGTAVGNAVYRLIAG